MQTNVNTEILDSQGPSWRQWILENLTRGCLHHAILESMVKDNTWSRDSAQSALNAGLLFLGHSASPSQILPGLPPEDRFLLEGASVEILSRMKSPSCALIAGLLSSQECGELIKYAQIKGLVASNVVDPSTGQAKLHEARTSSSVFLARAETPLIDLLEKRLSKLTSWPITHAESLQLQCYQPGQQYKAHFDWFDPTKTGSSHHLLRGGQRVSTTVIYLSVAQIGGRTIFPKVGFEVSPPVGGAIFFHDVDALGQPEEMSMHAGTPVEQGVKIVATYWQRESIFQ